MHGLEIQKPILTEIMNKLQLQLNKIGKDNQAEVLFYIDQGEKGLEEKKSWLMEQTTAKKYVFIDSASVIEDNFILLRLNAVKGLKSTAELLELGVYGK